jgi:toxin YoeB
MPLRWHDDAWDDSIWWQGQDRKIVRRINLLIRDIQRGDADGGLGKPERLKGDLAGWSSRRIDSEHRLVYRADGHDVTILQCRYHYEK